MIVLDTHVLVWVLDGSRRLGATAHDQVNQAACAGGVGLSAITPWEVALLAGKGRLRLGRDVAVPLVTADRAVLAYGRQGHVRVLDARR